LVSGLKGRAARSPAPSAAAGGAAGASPGVASGASSDEEVPDEAVFTSITPLIERFSLARVTAAPAVVVESFLRLLNQRHIKHLCAHAPDQIADILRTGNPHTD
jgi:hypothetical protein